MSPQRVTRAPISEDLIERAPKKSSVETAHRFFRAASLASLGLEMGIAVAVGWWVGSWLDKKLGTDPYLMILFLLFGVGAAFLGVFRTLRQIENEARQDAAESNKQSSDEPPSAQA
jgi:F0F1-type ATP synthase assembly protein I